MSWVARITDTTANTERTVAWAHWKGARVTLLDNIDNRMEDVFEGMKQRHRDDTPLLNELINAWHDVSNAKAEEPITVRAGDVQFELQEGD